MKQTGAHTVARPPTAAPQADPTRDAPQRASRGGDRKPPPSASPSPHTATPTATPKPKAKPAKKRPRVISSGSCQASFYGEGQMTASGESFDPSDYTAAHKTLPMGSKVKVTNKNNGRSVIVRINDRGPYAGGRCLDLSTAAMKKIGGTSSGVVPVRYQVLARA